MARNGVGRAVLVEAPNAGANCDGAGQRKTATNHVYDAGAGKVNCPVAPAHGAPQIRQPAAAPHPSAHNGVDQHADPEAHPDEALEVEPLGHGAGGDGGRGVHEDHLKEEEDQDAKVGGKAAQHEARETHDAPLSAKDKPSVENARPVA